MKKNYIYEIVNLVDGKTYVGQRKCKCEIAKDNYLGSGSILKDAKAKYGKENFKKVILEELPDNAPLSLINEREIYWIAKRKSEGKAEYNISGGGQACSNPFRIQNRGREASNLF